MSIATLGWYELPETRALHDELWARLAPHLDAAGVPDVPRRLSRPEDPHEVGDSLLLAQLCGFYVAGVGRDRAVPIAAVELAAPGCQGRRYRSFIAVPAALGASRFEDLEGRRAAINHPLSHSGCNALRRRVARAGASMESFFAAVVTTGAHVDSVGALRRGEVEVAAIDCVTWAMLERYRPGALEGLVALEATPLAPAPPLVTSMANRALVEPLRSGLASFFADPAAAPVREALLWGGFAPVDSRDYVGHFE